MPTHSIELISVFAIWTDENLRAAQMLYYAVPENANSLCTLYTSQKSSIAETTDDPNDCEPLWRCPSVRRPFMMAVG